MGSAQRIKSAVQSTSPILSEHLYVLGDPVASVVAFSSKTLNMYVVGDRMSKRAFYFPALHARSGVGQTDRLFLLQAAGTSTRSRAPPRSTLPAP